MTDVQGCHLVGSVPLENTEAVFRQCLAAAPNRLKRIPDGECGSRAGFTTFQAEVFNAYPAMKTEFIQNAPINTKEFTPEQIEEGIRAVTAKELQTGYDTAALESYATFKKLKEDGTIPTGVKFQVCIPTTPNVLLPFVQKAFQARMEPIYEAAIFRALRNIQNAIPHEDLAIQIDIAADTAFWEALNPESVRENSGLEWFKPWFEGDVREYCTAYVVRMIGQIDQDVEVGIHNCYGKTKFEEH